MTEVSKTTDAALNRGLAELMGYKMNFHETEGTYGLLRPDGSGFTGRYKEIDKLVAWQCAPDYCTDTAASLEVQAAAVVKDAAGYIRAIADTMGINFADRTLCDVARMFNATHRQRAEAAYMTLREVIKA